MTESLHEFIPFYLCLILGHLGGNKCVRVGSFMVRLVVPTANFTLARKYPLANAWHVKLLKECGGKSNFKAWETTWIRCFTDLFHTKSLRKRKKTILSCSDQNIWLTLALELGVLPKRRCKINLTAKLIRWVANAVKYNILTSNKKLPGWH